MKHLFLSLLRHPTAKLGCLCLVWVATTASADQAFDTAGIKSACTDLVLDYAYFRDRPDADGVAQLFTEDAQMTLLGTTFSGREAIRARLANADKGPVFRHLMSTIRIFVDSQDSAHGVSYVSVLTAPSGTLPRQLSQPAGVGEYHDEFVRTAQGWKIQKRNLVLVFAPTSDQ